MNNIPFEDWERERLENAEFVREVRRQMVWYWLAWHYHAVMAWFWRRVVSVLTWMRDAAL